MFNVHFSTFLKTGWLSHINYPQILDFKARTIINSLSFSESKPGTKSCGLGKLHLATENKLYIKNILIQIFSKQHSIY